VATSDEVLSGAYIKQIWWGAASNTTSVGYWNVKRNTTVVMVLTNSGWMDFSGHGGGIYANNTANLVFELVGAPSGALQCEIGKIANTGRFTTTDYS
jgi:hypothetical protein